MSNPDIPARKPMVLDLQPGTYHWCACGRSGKQPFCDGSHAGTEFRPKRMDLKEPEKIALCNCKHTANAPRCDGSHAKLP